MNKWPFIFSPDVTGALGFKGAYALLFTYEAGTSTFKAVYMDKEKTIPHTNPLVADSRGLFGDIYPEPGAYRLDLKTTDGVTIAVLDDVGGG